MTNEGFKEYVNGNMLFWAANVKSSEGYRGKLAHPVFISFLGSYVAHLSERLT